MGIKKLARPMAASAAIFCVIFIVLIYVLNYWIFSLISLTLPSMPDGCGAISSVS